MIGVDLVQEIRIKAILEDKYCERFLKRLCTEEERKSIDAIPADERSRAVSEIFAAKESVVKASATKLNLNDFPRINVRRISSNEITAVVSLSDEFFRVSFSTLGNCIFAVAVAVDHA